jgi:hypothetical protein
MQGLWWCTGQCDERKEKKPEATLKHETNIAVRSRFFYGPFLPIWYCINLSFCYLNAVCSAATVVLFVWIPCGIPYVKTTRWHTGHQEGYCKKIIMLNLVSAHIIHLVLENDFYLCSHKWLYFPGFQTSCRCFHRRCKACLGDVVRVHSYGDHNRKGKFYSGALWVYCDQKLETHSVFFS